MSDDVTESENWQLRAEAAEAALERAQAQARARIVRAELKAEAVKAGMIDLDGLKLIDEAGLRVNEDGEVEDAPAVLAKLKRAKPWLFGGGASSSAAVSAPKPEPPRQRQATEMSREEWLSARAALLRRR
ncbi:MAG TPA: hypothetical protein VMH92_08720 [Acidocella sp.]|nr:hypothetical protein [Acidocella sp.]